MIGCVTSASANVLVNGSPSGEFELERGGRQGDPLSPFLFLIVAEGLNLLIKNAVREGLLKAAQVGRDNIEVTHIQYADDTLFIVDGSCENAKAIKWLMKYFEALSGLPVNFEKSKVFGINIEENSLQEMAVFLGCGIGVGPVPYLGFKIGGRVQGVEGWSDVVEMVRSKLRGWEVKTISLGGRATLIQLSLSSIPLYWLSFLLLPKTVEKQLQSVFCNFLWGGNDVVRKIAWLRWEEVCRSKKEGGLGVKNLSMFNRALLKKWVWRFLTEKGETVGESSMLTTWGSELGFRTSGGW